MQPGHSVHRLHRRVRQEGNAVLGLERRAIGQYLVDVAVVAQPAVAVLLGHRCNDGIHHRRRAGRVAGLGPVALHGLRGLEGAPGVVGDDGDAAGQVDHLQHAAHRFGGGGVEPAERRAHRRVHAHGGKHHVGQPHVDAEGCRAGALGDHVDPRHRLAEVAPLLARFQRRAGRQVDRGRRRRQFRVGQASAVWGDDAAVVGLQLRRRQAEFLRRGRHQREPRRRAGDTHPVEQVGHAGGAAGDLHRQQLGHHAHGVAHGFGRIAVVQVGEGDVGFHQGAVVVGRARRAVLDADAVPRHIQFLGHHRRERGVDALAHLGARGDQRHALAIDAHIGRERGGALRQVAQQRIGRRLPDLVDAEGDAAYDGGRADQERAASDRCKLAHGQAPRMRLAAS